MSAHRFALALGGIFGGACALAACAYEVPDVLTSEGDASGVDAPADVATSVDANDASDAIVDAGGCNPQAPFGVPVILAELADPSYAARDPRLTADERTIHFAFGPPSGPFVLFVATRATSTGPFGKPSPVAGLTPSSGSDNNITVSADGLTALLSSNRTQGSVNPNVSQIWSTTRASTSSSFAAPVWANTGFGSQNGDFDPFFVEGAGGIFYLASAGYPTPIVKIRRSVFLGNNTFGDPSGPSFTSGNNGADERAPVVTPDELRIYYASNAGLDGGILSAGGNVWTSTRPSTAVAWQKPWVVAELQSFGTYPRPGWASADGCRLYLTSNKSGRDAIYVATRGK